MINLRTYPVVVVVSGLPTTSSCGSPTSCHRTLKTTGLNPISEASKTRSLGLQNSDDTEFCQATKINKDAALKVLG